MNLFREADIEAVRASLASSKYATGTSTHGFYHYPARFSPEIARAVIETFSAPNDWILDPFMGGGTTVVEGLALGRRMIGIDINALGHFVAEVRTTPLSDSDKRAIRVWATRSVDSLLKDTAWVQRLELANLPKSVDTFVSGALAFAEELRFPRRLSFARCALLRLGQWALDCRDFVAPRLARLAEKLPELIEEMFYGLDDFVGSCRAAGVPANKITSRRLLRHRSSVGIEKDAAFLATDASPRLVFTSPPYAGVHVLYHRWQYRGRKETAAPYRIANVLDGAGGSFYTAGSRTPTGLKNYFATITNVFGSVRATMDRRGIVVQLVGFARASEQLPMYLDAMTQAGFVEAAGIPDGGLHRRVPNRKWYAKLKGAVDASSEVLLIHRPQG